MRVARACLAGLLVTLTAAGGCRRDEPSGDAASKVSGGVPSTAAVPVVATFVGEHECTSCHSEQAKSWDASQHARAMMPATPDTVSGHFAGNTYRYNNIVSTFSRHDDTFQVRTDGPDGQLHDYPIAYTFGVAPLQQYLVAFPRGYYQALGLAWDSRAARDGGQRWFHLYPDEKVDAHDVLHWAGPAQNWNFTCAECHSTNLQKGYDAGTDSYKTTWKDMNVSCEACHGPGSEHARWARAGAKPGYPNAGLVFSMKDPSGGVWAMPSGGAIAKRTAVLSSRAEIETCARCHSRRGWVWPDFQYGKPLGDTHRVSLLDEGLYYADGQQQDEVYNYGSFLQSRMYASGVTCSNCHDPHSGHLRLEGNALCAQCHLPQKYDQPTHHFHKTGSAGAQCVSCHMPATKYMVIDGRRDHAFKVPRPDESVAFGVPNACNGCHKDKPATWAAQAVTGWFGPESAARPSWTGTIALARLHRLTSLEPLVLLAGDRATPAIVRATAVSLLQGYPGGGAADALRRAAGDEDALVRRAAAQALEGVDPPARLPIGLRLVGDPVRTVRLDAVMPLALIPASMFSPDERTVFDRAAAEYRAAQQFNAERAESLINLGALDQALGNLDQAEVSFRAAVARQPQFVPGYLNLADLARARDREDLAEDALRRGLTAVPDNAMLHHSLGLSLVRRHLLADAMAELARAVTLAPGEARFSYVYAVALHDAGHAAEARRALEIALGRQPASTELLEASASYAREAGDTAAAARWAAKLSALSGGQAGGPR